jgi:hypothetical protein
MVRPRGAEGFATGGMHCKIPFLSFMFRRTCRLVAKAVPRKSRHVFFYIITT